MRGILELDIKGIKEKAGGGQDDGVGAGESSKKSAEPQTEAEKSQQQQQQQQQQRQQQEEEEEEEQEEELGSEYEEVEVTDDEGEEGEEGEGNEDGGEEGGHRSKRQRTEEESGAADEQYNNNMPVEFNEDDIAYQLQAMGADYGLEPGEYDDGNADAWPEGAEGNPLSDEDARALFRDLLDDHGVNPYSPWEKLLEEGGKPGGVFDDPRYAALPTTRARREAWEEWSRERIRALRERRAREEQKDPRIAFLAFLQEKATSPRLYWAEFRRKYRREPAMRDNSSAAALADRDRERLYRDHVARLRLPAETRRKDLAALLREAPPRLLNGRTHPQDLPAQVLTDVRWISLDPATRDPLVEAYIQTLPPPPEEDGCGGGEDGEERKRREDDRRKRERALEERERVVAEEKRRQRRLLEHGRAALREEEREIERAMQVGKKGLQSQLEAAKERERGAEAEKEKEKEKESQVGEAEA